MSKLAEVIKGLSRVPKLVVFDIGKNRKFAENAYNICGIYTFRLHLMAIPHRLLWNTTIYSRWVNIYKLPDHFIFIVLLLLQPWRS